MYNMNQIGYEIDRVVERFNETGVFKLPKEIVNLHKNVHFAYDVVNRNPNIIDVFDDAIKRDVVRFLEQGDDYQPPKSYEVMKRSSMPVFIEGVAVNEVVKIDLNSAVYKKKDYSTPVISRTK